VSLGRVRAVAAESLRLRHQLLIPGTVSGIDFFTRDRWPAQLRGLFPALAAEQLLSRQGQDYFWLQINEVLTFSAPVLPFTYSRE
jgi:hypothetical protein